MMKRKSVVKYDCLARGIAISRLFIRGNVYFMIDFLRPTSSLLAEPSCNERLKVWNMSNGNYVFI